MDKLYLWTLCNMWYVCWIMYDLGCMLMVNRDPSWYSTDNRVYMGSSMTVRPLAGCHYTCTLINWLVLLQPGYPNLPQAEPGSPMGALRPLGAPHCCWPLLAKAGRTRPSSPPSPLLCSWRGRRGASRSNRKKGKGLTVNPRLSWIVPIRTFLLEFIFVEVQGPRCKCVFLYCIYLAETFKIHNKS